MDTTTDNPGGAATTGAGAQPPATNTPPAATDNPLNAFIAGNQSTDNPLNAAANTPATPPAETPPADPLAWLAEKFRTNGADGTLDMTASAKKLAESYSHLEKRNGSGELAPTEISGYKLIGEGLPAMEELTKFDDFNQFLTKAHAAGVNNAQLSLMVGELINQAQLNAPAAGMTAVQAEAELRKAWNTPDIYRANMANAVQLVRSAVPQADQQEFMNKYGTDPMLLQVLAKLGSELGEDRMALIGEPILNESDIDQLMLHPGYRDAKHPEHAAIRQKVTAFFQRTAGTSKSA